jgi:hypothetical protein
VNVHPDPRDDRPLSTAQAAQAARVAEHVIRTWRTRGWISLDGSRKKLPVAATDSAGRPLHRYSDVLNAERETRRSGKSHRRVGPPQADWEQLNRQAS